MSESARFPEDLIQAVDYGLAVPVELVRAAICERIERNYPLARDEAPDKLETFHKALQVILGASAKVIERLIAKNFYERLGLDFTGHNDWTIVEYFDHIKTARGGKLYLDLIKSHSNMTIAGPEAGVVKSH
jgi:hypothetical protein